MTVAELAGWVEKRGHPPPPGDMSDAAETAEEAIARGIFLVLAAGLRVAEANRTLAEPFAANCPAECEAYDSACAEWLKQQEEKP